MPLSADPSLTEAQRAESRDTEIRGRVEAVFYTCPTFTAGRLRAADGTTLSFAGKIVARIDDAVVLRGAWERHRKFGRQFKVETFTFDQTLDAAGLAHFLANHPDAPGIGPARAKRIAEAFGADFERVLDEDPEQIADVGGIPIESVRALQTAWEKTRLFNTSLTWLAGFGLTHHQVTTLIDAFGNGVVTTLKEDPYRIARAIPGFGFKRLDLVARKMGTAKDHPSRLAAGIVHCVEEALDDGDCWVDFEELVERANTLLVLDALGSREKIEQSLDALVHEEALACVSLGGRFLVARPDIYKMEKDLARGLAEELRPNPHVDGLSPATEKLVDRVAPDLNAGQRLAVLAALSHNQVLISGGAGSGKTYTIAAIVRACEARGLKVVLAAPTGKAAKRIEQVVGRDASTIHRLLEFNGEEFKKGPEEPIEADVVIVDEVSMVDVPLAWRLFRALRLARMALVLVGDHNQLPPVGPGNLLRDLIERRPIPTVILDEIVRQAGVLKENSTAILRGEVRKTAEPRADGRRPWYLCNQFDDALDAQRFVLDLYETTLAEKLRFDLLADVQLLTPMRKGPLGVDALNVALQRLLQKKLRGVDVAEPRPGRRPEFLVGDKVLQTRNNYHLDVMNGAVGTVVEVDRGAKTLRLRFDEREFEIDRFGPEAQQIALAYALTIHKAQGSEFRCAVVIVHKAHAFMHHRNLLYTGVTRAREVAVLVGDRWGMRHCAEKQQVERRKTFLSVLDFPPETGDA
jgi:exodeoxyribonuclease V alpha subunit